MSFQKQKAEIFSMKRRSDYSQSGFTLMEIMISMILLLVLGSMALSIFASGSKTSSSSAMAVAYNHAQSLLEEFSDSVKISNWHPSTAGRPLSLINPQPYQGSTISLDGRTFTVTYNVNSGSGNIIDQEAAPDGKDDYRRVAMQVAW